MSELLRIAQLYPDELGITGDRGNVLALQARWERAGGVTEHVLVGHGDAIPADADVVVIGNGPLSAMRLVLPDLREKAAELEALVVEGAPLLAVGGGAELLGESVETLDGELLDGVGLFPIKVRRVRDRRVGYVVADTAHGQLVGFEDHASEWALVDGGTPYGALTAGKGSFARGQGRGEGVRRGDAYATNVQGPALPLNPQLTDALLSAAARRRDYEYRTGEAHAEIDRLAEGARAAVLARAGKVFNSMGV